MRPTILAAVLASLCLAGCSNMGTSRPAPVRDRSIPVASEKPDISGRVMEQRIHKAEVAQGEIAVEGTAIK